ncbi:MFS transporter [Dactylosporangium sp. NPDC005555]|uniref:MFS transporter n=1 Tax=Dactylosporangium sp. NPDC005555 TaxID=3154889 RepID=UPI0033B87DEF
MIVFGLASFLIGVAPTGWWLIAARALQGVGAAVVAPASLSLLTAALEGRERTHAVAAYGIGAGCGLVVGGALADLLSWLAGFIINVPTAAAAVKYIPDTERSTGRFDLIGAVCATLGMGAAVVFGIVNAADHGWASSATITALAIGAIVLAAPIHNEARAEQPIMPLHLFANHERAGVYLARTLFASTMIGFFFTTQFLQTAYGFSPLQAGLGFLPITAVNFLRRPAHAVPDPEVRQRRPAHRRPRHHPHRIDLANPGHRHPVRSFGNNYCSGSSLTVDSSRSVSLKASAIAANSSRAA